MITLGDVQNNIEVQNVAGCVPTSPQFISLVNSTVDRLMPRGDWKGTVLPVRVCVMKGCITWPRYVDQVRYINGCRRQIAMRSQWYEFLQWDGPRHMHEWQGWCGEQRDMELQYRAPTYQDIYGPNCQVRIYPRVAADMWMVNVQIFGIDNNGQTLQTQNFAQCLGGRNHHPSGFPVRRIGGICFSNRPRVETNHPRRAEHVRLGYGSQSIVGPGAIRPVRDEPQLFAVSIEGGSRSGQSCQGCPCLETIIAMVKLKHVRATLPSDLVLIDSFPAMILSFMALKEEANKNFTAAANYWQLAITELNRQLENEVA